MISDEKLYRLANNLVSLIGGKPKSPTEAYQILSTNRGGLDDYFKYLGPESFIKLSLFYWGIHNKKSFEKIQKIFEDLFFAVVFETEGNQYRPECEDCGGSGEFNCGQCDGDGEVECSECDGDGNVACDECGGDGKVPSDDGGEQDCDECAGDGYVECDNCRGGKTSCGECDGTGTEECSYCDGDGAIDTDDVEYNVSFIVSWDKTLRDRCELEEGKINSIMSSFDFYNTKKVLVLNKSDEHDELNPDLEDDEIYCLRYYGDSPTNLLKNTFTGKRFVLPDYNLGELQG